MRRLAVLVSLAALGGCGDDNDPNASPDAPRADAMVADARPDGEPVPDSGGDPCRYNEQSDLTNDTVFGTGGASEDTGITFTGHTIVCGSLSAAHFSDDIVVDVDVFQIEVSAATDVLVRLSGPAQAIEYAGVDVSTDPTFDTALGSGTFYGAHGVVAVHLEPGTYYLAPFALNSEAIAADVPYMIEVVTDVPATRCAALTTGGYAEAADGATSTGNDVVTIPNSAPPALSASPTDAPEPTALVLDTAATRVTGSAADVVVMDQYEDKDTYLVTTSASTNELTIRVDTAVATADLDVFVFEVGVVPPIFRGASVTAKPETIIIPLKPSTPYWITVAAKLGSTGLPAAYSATLCGASYSQPLWL